MFWDIYTHNMPGAEWFGQLSLWLLLFLALRYGLTIHRIPNPDRQRGVNVRRVDGGFQLDLMCRRPLSNDVAKHYPESHSLRFLFAPTEL
ncbi:uncharacterized protein FPRO_13323 [Fusarium proliferatum ET1]|uniref:Uncharacterized protein n=2 Tax=Gibberella intermedia TaxID=948311 RepID=A0A1L7W5J8_FUSPR|nr:uncharacterized protein FPRO_13323 [Fusarium proliferatum ET1]CZR47656.1 uncharacterized protein FPRO_13323 [Fusarium proliferatum ET1]